MALIEVNNLKIGFKTYEGTLQAVDNVSFSIERNKVLGIVGESGCGKSVTARALLGLTPLQGGTVEQGEVLYRRNGQAIDLTQLDPTGKKIREIRGNEIAMIFQEPMTALNPAFVVGNQIMESILLHQCKQKKEARQRAIDMLASVGIPAPEKRINEYPHQLSGGMRQRVMIAMALSCNPSLLIADEPTTALDVTIQAQVLDLINECQKRFETAVLFITHDLGVVAEMADDIAVMYLGTIIEQGSVRDVFHRPHHPYTQGLMKSIPSLTSLEKEKLAPIKGVVPNLQNIPRGCRFEPRCDQSMEVCKHHAPALKTIEENHSTACFLYEN